MSLMGQDDDFALLGSLGKALAIGAEAGEDIDGIGTDGLDLKVTGILHHRMLLGMTLP